MNHRISLAVLILLLFSVSAFAQFNELDIKIPVFKQITFYAAAVPGEDGYIIPQGIVNNEYYLQSVLLTEQARETFDSGLYDASVAFAEEAIYFAKLSDEYVSEQLIAEAERLLSWANGNNIPAKYPYYYSVSRNYYETSLASFQVDEWDGARTNAIKSIEILANLQSGRTPVVEGGASLPSQYTVRPWITYGDCLWKIAADPGVFGDASRWPELYEANKARMPQPDNPHLILIGFIINIPGENRSGMWDPSIKY